MHIVKHQHWGRVKRELDDETWGHLPRQERPRKSLRVEPLQKLKRVAFQLGRIERIPEMEPPSKSPIKKEPKQEENNWYREWNPNQPQKVKACGGREMRGRNRNINELCLQASCLK